MNLPKIITDFINAQNNHDSVAFANCFAKTAAMFDEGKEHIGRAAIQEMIEESNRKYQSTMKPLNYEESGSSGVLSAEISGTFDGSPIVLKFHFELDGGQITYLKVTG